jgi:hypothetical protein
MTEITHYVIDQAKLPAGFPTQRHTPLFWERLGRTVATFGLLEEVLCKAIFAFTATKPYPATEIEAAYVNWLPKLQKALSDQLGGLIDTYGKAVREHPDSSIENLSELLDDMKAASKIRNVLCHGSWRTPTPDGASTPFFVNRQNERFETAINEAWLDQTQRHVVTLICSVINTVTHMGWQFPGTIGPGVPVWEGSEAQNQAPSAPGHAS